MRRSFSSHPSQEDFHTRLLRAETQWDIRPEVAQEWEPTFEQFLKFYNTQDMNTIITTLRPGKTEQKRTDNKLPISELRNWMKPKFKPPTWKKLFCNAQYVREKEINEEEFETLFGGAEEAANDTRITRAQFIDRIMEELRDGNKNV